MLAYGLSHVPHPELAPVVEMVNAATDFMRRIKLQLEFRGKGESKPVRFKLPNSEWQPPLEKYEKAEIDIDEHCQRLLNEFSSKVAREHGRLAKERKHNPIWQPFSQADLEKIKKTNGITIKPADKNLGLTIVDTEWYLGEANRQLNDRTTYEIVPGGEPMHELREKLVALISHLASSDDSTANDLYHWLLQYSADDVHRTPRFYMIIKIHKDPVAGRPITSIVNSLFLPASQWLDAMLQPVLRKVKSYVKNSAAVQYALLDKSYPAPCILVTYDVVSLYTNIPIEEGIEAIRYYTEGHTQQGLILALLELISKNSYFEHGDTTYHQIRGTAMGHPLAVCFACLFIAYLEEVVLPTVYAGPMPSFWKRYIDDGAIVWLGSEKSFNVFQKALGSLHESIKLTWIVSTRNVPFLDLMIYRLPNCTMGTRTFQKALNRYLYLPYMSYHTDAQKKSFVTSLLMSYVVHNTQRKDYLTLRQRLYQRLRARAYPAKWLNEVFDTVTYDEHDRKALIAARALGAKKREKGKAEHLKFVICNDDMVKALPLGPTLRALRTDLIQLVAEDSDGTVDLSWLTEPLVCLKGPPNLAMRLVSSVAPKLEME
jgi:hypothetical protein